MLASNAPKELASATKEIILQPARLISAYQRILEISRAELDDACY